MNRPGIRSLCTASAALFLATTIDAQVAVSATAIDFSAFTPGASSSVTPGVMFPPTNLNVTDPAPLRFLFSTASYDANTSGPSVHVDIDLSAAMQVFAAGPGGGQVGQNGRIDLTLTSPNPQPVSIAIQSMRSGPGTSGGTIGIGPSFSYTVPYDSSMTTHSVIVDSVGVVISVDVSAIAPVPANNFAYLASLDLTITDAIEPAAGQRLGVGCSGTAGVPDLDMATLPWVGEAWTQDVQNAPAGAAVVLQFGFDDTMWVGGLALPFDLSPLGMTGCTQYLDPVWVKSLVADGTGAATHTIVITPLTGLVGLELFSQAFVFDPVANPAGLTMSNAMAWTIGAR
ncbi:MAG: hypothetical protein KDB80_03810 [Planctomycetes bacterium]|nr:hypothetical protein [Planctomycetota bacterium]